MHACDYGGTASNTAAGGERTGGRRLHDALDHEVLRLHEVSHALLVRQRAQPLHAAPTQPMSWQGMPAAGPIACDIPQHAHNDGVP